MTVGLLGRHVEKTDTLDLFPSSAREPKNEGLHMYTYVYYLYICVRFELKFSTGQVAPKPDSFKTRHLGDLATLYDGTRDVRPSRNFRIDTSLSNRIRIGTSYLNSNRISKIRRSLVNRPVK